ncbi:MAG TPA: hypothetical protein VKQ30_04960 [Ktedonobacterales bacterium]|nr:hypothetical protein [Ktedonobacterales bacterium]
MAFDVQRIAELSRAAESLISGPPEYLRAFLGDEGARQQRRAILIASLREQEMEGRVGVSVDELAADVEAVLRYRGQSTQDDLRPEIVEVLRQLEGWQAVDGGLAPDRAEREGLRRRVERDYALARTLRVFLPHWDEVQRALRRRYVSLSANYFAQAITALDTLLDELHYEDTDPLRCHTAWQSLRQALHGINTESRDFARELRSLQVDGNHPEVLADIADRLGILHEKFFRVAAEGAAKVRERLELLRDERHDGENVRRLQEALRRREEEWSVGVGETDDELRERLDSVAHDVQRELVIFERLMAESGPGSWREGARAISLALVDLTERIHSAISLRLQQTQAIAALLRRARDLAQGNADATQRARQYLWNASGAVHAAIWVQAAPSSDDQVRLDRWLALRGGSPLPLVDEDVWRKSLRPRHRPAPPQPPVPLVTADDWNPGEDPRVRELEEARERLIGRLIAAGSAEALITLESFDELRLLASFLWLPRDSAPLRRLGLRIQSPATGGAQRAMLRGPDFEVELDNYRFMSTAAAKQTAVERTRPAQPPARPAAALPGQRSWADHPPLGQPMRPPAVAAAAPLPAHDPSAANPTHPLYELSPHPSRPVRDKDGDELDGPNVTRPLPAIPTAYATHPLADPTPPGTSSVRYIPSPHSPAAARPVPQSPTPSAPAPEPQSESSTGRRLWPFSRRGTASAHPTPGQRGE